MFKPAADYLSWLDFALFIPYYILGLLFLIFILKSFNLNTKRNFFYCLFFFSLYLTLWAVSYINGIFPLYPDVELYSKIVAQNYFPEEQSRGVMAYYYLDYPLRAAGLFSIFAHVVFQIIIYFISVLFIWKSWQLWCDFKNIHTPSIAFTLYLALGFLFPAAMLFIPIPVREYIFTLGFSMMVYAFICRTVKQPWLTPIFVSFSIMVLVRPQLLLAIPIFFMIESRHPIRNAVTCLIIFPLVSLVAPSIIGHEIGPAQFSFIRNALVNQFEYTGFVYGKVEWENYLDMILDLPLLFLQFMLAPWPILHSTSPLKMIAAFIDLVFCLVIYSSLLFKPRQTKPYLVIFLIFAITFSLWEFFVPDAIRHRLALMLLLLPHAATIWSSAFQNYFIKLDNK